MRNEHAAAILALLNANLATMATPRHAYELDDAPKTGGDYVAITLSRRFGGNVRNAGVSSPSSWRVTTRAVGVGVTNAGALLDRCTAALEGVRITVSSLDSTPIAFETEDVIAEDEYDADLWSGMRQWTYAF